MKPPKPEKVKKNYTISKSQAKDLKLGYALVGLEISKWNNLNELASHAFTLKRQNAPTTADWSLNLYKSTLSKIAKHFIRYTELRTFANKLKLYLEDEFTTTTYTNIFNKLALKKEEKEAEEHMNTIADINAKKLTSIAGNRLKRTLDEVINNVEGSSSAITNESAYSIDETTDESSGSSTSRQRKSSDTSNFQGDASNSTDSEQIEQSHPFLLFCFIFSHFLSLHLFYLTELKSVNVKILHFIFPFISLNLLSCVIRDSESSSVERRRQFAEYIVENMLDFKK